MSLETLEGGELINRKRIERGIRCALWLRNRDEAADHHDRESLLQVQPELDVHPRNVSCFQQTLHSLQL